MRHARAILQYAVMWVLVFGMAVGPLPLGVPRAEAAAAITDTPGIKNFFTPKLFVILDTSKSMVFRPGDINGDLSAATEDWDPNVPTPDPQCENKWCLGKRALYKTLPKYTSRMEIGLSGYNQYFQLTTEPANFATTCYYDRIAYGNAQWGNPAWMFTRLDDLTGTGTDPLATQLQPASVEISYQSPSSPTMQTPHRTRKWGIATGASGDRKTINVVGAGYGLGDTQTFGGYTYDWLLREDPGFRDDLLKSSLGGSCPASIAGFTGGSCGAQPCDQVLDFPFTVPFGNVYTGSDFGPSATFSGVTYTLSSGPNTSNFNDACGKTSPYAGAGAGCNGVVGGCTVNQIAGPFNTYSGGVTYFNSGVSPGLPSQWQLMSTTTGTTDVQLTAFGATCPAIGTVITATSGPAEWQSMATGGSGPGLGGNNCTSDPRYTCTWTMSQDIVIPGETYQHFCRFTRPQYNWQQYTQQCTYQTQTWTYTTVYGTDYCRYKHYRDVFTHPIYSYSYLPNDGDIVGYTFQKWAGNDDLNGKPTAVTYSGGQFSNGDCPNLIQNSATNANCQNGVLCKLSWRTNTTIGANNYPNGRYSLSPYGGWPWATAPAGFVTAADPVGTLTDPNFPPNPMGYSGDWLTGGGHPDIFTKNLMANIYNPIDTNPPAPPLYSCPTCTYQYAYTDPPTIDAAGFAAVAASMPPNRDSGWGQLHDGRAAISWSPMALDSALLGATPATDGPVLKMLSKYDPVTNPTGLRTPDFGDYTPLTGSLRDARLYIQTVIDSDPYAGCGRSYYVMLLTDGEEQPVGLPGNDPVGAVTALRNMTTSGGLPVDVKTFVIGFGLFTPSPQLNSMAQAGGTAVSSSDLTTLDLSASGVAFDGSTPDRLLASLEGAFGRILEGYFTRSKPAVNVAGTEMYVGYFRLLFNGLEWQGKLDAIDIDGKNLPSLADTVTDTDYSYLWRYGDPDTSVLPSSSINKQVRRTVYTSLDPSSGNRIFFDYSACAGCATSNGWNSNAAGDQTALEAMIAPVPEDARRTIALLLNPGKNEQFTNGVNKRSRASDIFHSDPAIIEGAVQSNSWPDGTEAAAYSTFQNNVKDRKKTVYIGANDGMLHAVEDAVTSPGAVVDPIAGSERWGYVPMQLLSIVSQMRDAHTYGVDGSVAVADVCGAGFSGSPCTAADGWRTLLVGVLGRGGRGLYALDITDPSNPLPKWETNGAPPGIPRLGQTWGPPVIARTSVGGLGKPWSVFVGGGILPALDAQAHAFYVLDARTGTLLDDGTTKAAFDIWDDPADPTINTVASRPTLYRPADKSMVERVFFNDTEGKVWRMNTTSTSLASWAVSAGVPTAADAFFDPANASGNGACLLDVNGNTTPILDATTGVPVMVGMTPLTLPLSNPRPKIFNRPMLALDQTGLLNVYVGTGDTDHPNDPLGTWDYFYAMTDTGTGCARPLFVLRFAQNEKMLADPAFLNNVIFGTTYLPPSANLCTDAGSGFLYAWDARTGQPVAAIKDPITGLYVSKLDLSANPQLKGSGIPSAPIIRNGKLFVAVETDPAHPRQIDLGSQPIDIKVKAWQRVK